MALALIAVLGIVLGVAIGAVGIGGVLLVPALAIALELDVKRAIAAALFSYLPSCVVAVTLYARRGSIPWREAWVLCAAALPGAWLGARVSHIAPGGLLEAAIGALLLTGGLYALRGPGEVANRRSYIPIATLLGLGAATGFIAALTGAGGAFVLLPVLLLLDVPILPAIGLGQAIALPIAGLASVVNLVEGLVDLRLALILAVTLSVGIAIGTPIAHSLPQAALRRLLGIVVVLAGIAMLVRAAVH
jgi:uncharacterized membrane protein YfcA